MPVNLGSLSDIMVLDLSRLLPGPYCSMILADHGARVIAVEDKRYKSEGLFLSPVYRNKEHISLDLKKEKGKEIFFRLAEKADIILEGFRPGVVDRLGVDYESIKKINPGIIYCSITGYGQTGPYRDRAGHDANYLSIAGVLGLIGQQGMPPSIPGVQLADIAGGGMNAALGVLLALHARGKSGKGQYIDISMTDGMAGFLSVPLFFKQLTGKDPERSDNMLSHRYACYSTYETADKKYLSLGAVENRFWKVVCEKLGKPDYISLQYDDDKRQEIHEFLEKEFKTKTLNQWKDEFKGLDVCWGPVNTISEALEDPHLRDRDMVVEMEDNKGKTTTLLGVPIKMSDTPGSLRTPPVEFGASTKDILMEMRYSDKDINNFAQQGVI